LFLNSNRHLLLLIQGQKLFLLLPIYNIEMG